MTIELRLSSVSVLLSWLWLDFLASSSFSLVFFSVLLMAQRRRRHKYARSTAMATKNPPTVTTIGIVPDLREKIVMGLELLLWWPPLGVVVSAGIADSTLVELLAVIGVSLVRLFGVVELVLTGVVGVTSSSGCSSSPLCSPRTPGIFGGGGG